MMTNEELKSYFPHMHRHIKEADFNCGVAFEQERIVKLLEDKQYFAGFLLDWAYTKPSAEDALLVAQTVIALIKGEQK